MGDLSGGSPQACDWHNLPADGAYIKDREFKAKSFSAWLWNSAMTYNEIPGFKWAEVEHFFEEYTSHAWYYLAVGSSVWLYMGNTVVYADHPDGVSDLLGRDCNEK